MIVTVRQGENAGNVQHELTARGLWTQQFFAGSRVHFLVEPHSQRVAPDALAAIPGVESVAVSPSGHPRVDALPRKVRVGSVELGVGGEPVLMAGPCSVESPEQLEQVASALQGLGIRLLRGGAFKPRSSPYAFQGRGEVALRWLRDVADRHQMHVVTEAMGQDEVGRVTEVADLVQIGSRNMHNYALLRTVGRAGKPILLKRGMAATVEEWLLAGEYCLSSGAPASCSASGACEASIPARGTCSIWALSRCSSTSTACRWWSTLRTRPGAAT